VEIISFDYGCRNTAYITANAGFYVDPDQPHQVKLEGKVVGDIDILAGDPRSEARIGVTPVQVILILCGGNQQVVSGSPDYVRKHFLWNVSLHSQRLLSYSCELCRRQGTIRMNGNGSCALLLMFDYAAALCVGSGLLHSYLSSREL